MADEQKKSPGLMDWMVPPTMGNRNVKTKRATPKVTKDTPFPVLTTEEMKEKYAAAREADAAMKASQEDISPPPLADSSNKGKPDRGINLVSVWKDADKAADTSIAGLKAGLQGRMDRRDMIAAITNVANQITRLVRLANTPKGVPPLDVELPQIDFDSMNERDARLFLAEAQSVREAARNQLYAAKSQQDSELAQQSLEARQDAAAEGAGAKSTAQRLKDIQRKKEAAHLAIDDKEKLLGILGGMGLSNEELEDIPFDSWGSFDSTDRKNRRNKINKIIERKKAEIAGSTEESADQQIQVEVNKKTGQRRLRHPDGRIEVIK